MRATISNLFKYKNQQRKVQVNLLGDSISAKGQSIANWPPLNTSYFSNGPPWCVQYLDCVKEKNKSTCIQFNNYAVGGATSNMKDFRSVSGFAGNTPVPCLMEQFEQLKRNREKDGMFNLLNLVSRIN